MTIDEKKTRKLA